MASPLCRQARSWLWMLGLLSVAIVVIGALFSGTICPQAHADEDDGRSVRVIYHFVAPEQLDSETSFEDYQSSIDAIYCEECWIEEDRVVIQANHYPDQLPLEANASTLRVLKNYASSSATSEGMQDLSAEAAYDDQAGTISLPASYAEDDLTVVWYVSEDLRSRTVPLVVDISKTIEGTSSQVRLEKDFLIDAQAIDLKLFDDEERAGRIENIKVTQGGCPLSQFIYQNGSISICTSPLAGPIQIELSDQTEPTEESEDGESAFNSEDPLISLFSAANPAVGERFTLAADSAFVRTSIAGNNSASVLGWPEKAETYGFLVHFNSCPNPEVVNADQNHIASGGIVHTRFGDTFDYNWAKGLHFAWGDCYGDVSNNGLGEPRVTSGWVEVTHVDYNTQTVSYRYFLDVCSDYDGHNMQSIVGTFQVHEDLVGYLAIDKTSALPDTTNDNPCYALVDARYGIYSDEECSDLVQTLITDESGQARSKALPVGTYYVKELSAPSGFALDTQPHMVDVSAGTTRTCTLEDVPQSAPTPSLLIKHDADRAPNSEHNDIQGGATSFKGAEFKVTYYPTLEENYSQVEPLRTWVFATNSDGIVDLTQDDACKIAGDELFYDSTGAVSLPIGTYTIQETKAPEGYRLNESLTTRVVEGAANCEESAPYYDVPVISDTIMRGGIKLEKRDAETGLKSSLGCASLDGTIFTIINANSHDVQVDGIFFSPGEVCCTLITNEGDASTSASTLPYGEYVLQEKSAGDGYNLTDNAPRHFTIESDGQMVTFSDSDESTDGGSFKNLVKRGDLNFIKVRDQSGQRLAGVPFKITSETTGESHVIVSDPNGVVDTSAEWNAHTFNTNQNDEGAFDFSAGIWFGGSTEGNLSPARDDRGALPFDLYTLEELPCQANEGLELIKTSFSIYREDQRLDFGVVEDHDPDYPWITTVATDSADHDKLLYFDRNTVINDHVRYGNLKAGETYTLEARLVDKASGETIEGVSGTTTFTASSDGGSTEVSIPVNLSALQSDDVVVYETLIESDGTVIEHAEKDNSEQTLSVIKPKIGTEVVDTADGDHEIFAEAEIQLVDTVNYLNLIAGEEYHLVGEIMIVQTSEDDAPQTTPLVDEAGEAVKAETTFTPLTSSGSAEVHFTFDASALEAGTKLVVFEYLERDDVPVADHCDPDDMNQTINVVEEYQPPQPLNNDDTEDPEGPMEALQSFFAKTGGTTFPIIACILLTFVAAITLIGIGYHRRRRAKQVSASIARNMLGSPAQKR